VVAGLGEFGRLPAVFTTPGISSFSEFLSIAAPDLLPGRRPLPPGTVADMTTQATTIVALICDGGVVMAGDRRATQGNLIAMREVEKVFPADPYSLVGMAGSAGIGVELIRLFQLELEHYEKIEGSPLSLHGKANRLSALVRGNLGAAMQGLGVLPIFAGFDPDAPNPAEAGHIFSFDIAGGFFEERDYYSIGSGSIFARAALKKRYRRGVTAQEAIRLAVEALYDAADEDSATGGPDLTRRIYPVIMTATAEGTRRLTDEEAGEVVAEVVAGRMENPGG